MNVQLFIALLALTGATVAQDTGTWVSGRDSPESFPDWIVLDRVLNSALKADEAGNGEQYLVSGLGVSREGANALLIHTRTASLLAREPTAQSLKDNLCPRREKLVAGDALARALDGYLSLQQERKKQRVEAAYDVLSREDADKLRHYVTTSLASTNVFQADVQQLARGIGDPKAFLDGLCGGAR